MATLIHTLDELYLIGGRGATLAEAAARLSQRHISLILGCHNIFNILASIGYLNSDQIAWPPHTDNPDFHAEEWSLVGLGDEVRALIPLLPYTEQFEADVMAPYAKSLPYLGEPDLHVRDPRFNELDEDLLPPQFLRLTEDVGGEGEVLVYDTLEAQLGWWDTAGTLPQSAGEAMRNLDWHPATLLSTYAQRILELEWLPNNFTPGGPVLEEAPATLPPQQQMPTYALPIHWHINRVNYFRARQHAYKQHGWPGPDYDRQQALQALENLEVRSRELEEAMLPRPDRRTVDDERYHPATQHGQARALTQFLQDAAGSTALTSPTFEECHRSAAEWEDSMKRDGTDPS